MFDADRVSDFEGSEWELQLEGLLIKEEFEAATQAAKSHGADTPEVKLALAKIAHARAIKIVHGVGQNRHWICSRQLVL